MLILLSVIWIASTASDGIVGLANRAPGLPSGESRLELFESTTKLIGDFPFTGGGLRSFAGLYSQYIRVTPDFLFSYSHNFYLDVLLEQGIIGGFVLLILILGSAWLLVKQVLGVREDSITSLLYEAVLIGFLVLLIHGRAVVRNRVKSQPEKEENDRNRQVCRAVAGDFYHEYRL